MKLPILGNKNAEKPSELQRKAEIEYQQEMSKTLENWEVDHSCKVLARIVKDVYPDAEITKSVTYFYKLSVDELNAYKLTIQKRNENSGDKKLQDS